MKIQRRKRLGGSESSASSDIAFLLIIYFIVIAGFNINKGFLFELPAKNSSKVVTHNDVFRVELNEKGVIIILNRETSREEAESLIKAAAAANPNLALMLSIAPAAPWQSVVSFVETARNLNIDSFSFSMKDS